MIRVLVVDDHRLLRDGVRLLLETVDGVTVTAEAHDGQQALVMVERCVPDVVLTDARMPGMDGIDLIAACRARYPQLPVLVLTTFDDEDVVHGALDAGAAGFLLKDVSPETLAEAITAVTRGEMVIDPRVVRIALRPPSRASADPLATLTRTERVVATHLARGRTNREVADAMVIAEGTVKNHVSAVVRKLGQRDRTATALLVREHVSEAG